LNAAVFAAYGWKPDLADADLLAALPALNQAHAAPAAADVDQRQPFKGPDRARVPAEARGDLIAAAAAQTEVADQFEAHLVWMSDRPLLPGRSYWLKLSATTVPVGRCVARHTAAIPPWPRRS
jgi:hypothetical protein